MLDPDFAPCSPLILFADLGGFVTGPVSLYGLLIGSPYFRVGQIDGNYQNRIFAVWISAQLACHKLHKLRVCHAAVLAPLKSESLKYPRAFKSLNNAVRQRWLPVSRGHAEPCHRQMPTRSPNLSRPRPNRPVLLGARLWTQHNVRPFSGRI